MTGEIDHMVVGERAIEESKAEIQELLDAIRRLLEHNAVEVWQSYRQIRFE